jgi:RND family efflux transporter MFP subunit
MAARVTIPESGEGLLTREPLSGKVDFTDNRIDRMTGTITMRAAVANPEGMLLEGTFVYVEVMITDQVSFLMVPPGVVQNDQRGSYVYVVDETGSSKRVDIVRGYESRHYLLVKEGLEGGETVIASGLAKIVPGTKVKPTDVTDEKGVMALLTRAGMVPDKG